MGRFESCGFCGVHSFLIKCFECGKEIEHYKTTLSDGHKCDGCNADARKAS